MFQPYVCNGCHNLMPKTASFNDVTIISIKEHDYRIHFWYIRKSDAIKIMKTSDLNEKSVLL